jgi:hypothetical protein
MVSTPPRPVVVLYTVDQVVASAETSIRYAVA